MLAKLVTDPFSKANGPVDTTREILVSVTKPDTSCDSPAAAQISPDTNRTQIPIATIARMRGRENAYLAQDTL